MSEDLGTALKLILGSGYQLTSDGFKYLGSLKREELEALVNIAIQKANSSSEEIYLLDKKFLQSILQEGKENKRSRNHVTGKKRDKPLAGEYEARIEIIKNGPSQPASDLKGFTSLFRSRFRKIEAILRERIDVRDAITIGRALEMPLRSKFKIIGIVTRKTSRGVRLFFEIEDLDNSIGVMASNEEAVRNGLSILEDQVICIDVLKYRKDLLIANDFILPDIPSKSPSRSEVPLCAAFLSDLQVGSKLFLEDLFRKFVDWMKMEIGPPESRRLAGRVKYIIIAGDIVDGIGVYPNQMDELVITDVRDQYKAAGSLLSLLPEYVELIVIPGNHDAVRRSIPQPAISKEYAEDLHNDQRIRMLGNPSQFLLEGVEVLSSHGKPLDDVLSQTPGLDFNSPVKGMELLLRSRHLAPIYGSSTPIAPEEEDGLVISSTPDIFQMGHVHIYNSKKYKGVNIIASSTWQGQTSFQKRMNIEPTPGIVPIIDLHTHQLIPLDFKLLDG
jgi:DNA polymerase II small subunit